MESRILQRIRSLVSRGQGSRVISQDILMNYPNFKDQIQILVGTIDDDQALIEFYTEDLITASCGTPKDQQKLVNTLLRKGFDYESIKRFM